MINRILSFKVCGLTVAADGSEDHLIHRFKEGEPCASGPELVDVGEEEEEEGDDEEECNNELVFRSSFSTAPVHRLDSPQKDSGTEEEEEEEEEDNFESDATDNSSDVLDITEDSDVTSTLGPRRNVTGSPPCVYITLMESDEDGDDTISIEEDTISFTEDTTPPEDDVGPWVGELVLGSRNHLPLWPGIVRARGRASTAPRLGLVEWYGGDGTYTEVNLQSLQPCTDFNQCYCDDAFSTKAKYRTAIFQFLQEAAGRCRKKFSPKDPKELLVHMLDWAFHGFQPTGPPTGSKQPAPPDDEKQTRKLRKKKKKPQLLLPRNKRQTQMSTVSRWLEEVSPSQSQEDASTTPGKGKKRHWGKEGEGGGLERTKDGSGEEGTAHSKGLKKRPSLLNEFEKSLPADFMPTDKKKALITKEAVDVYIQPDQKDRETTICRIREEGLDIEVFCLCCGTADVDTSHPLFKGSLCPKCKDNFTETLYHYDEDGYQSYCTICCYGLEVILCGNDSCCRSFCLNCLDILVGPGTFDSLKEMDPWICYLCQPLAAHGALEPREDWSIRVQEFFANNSGMSPIASTRPFLPTYGDPSEFCHFLMASEQVCRDGRGKEEQVGGDGWSYGEQVGGDGQG
ncbi:DNA (cytosine-5)-methyltransferase 3A [Merluccius polli]|uniref:DNA (Cytosine-5)-methyltransferase 3A n=1 Tax=Merluccius polli TaxID=89951 RepID=A0AA47P6V5_MERPO|nr:DNA (cytosine-5)-methyltransferase 3A [Merluccius polli]